MKRSHINMWKSGLRHRKKTQPPPPPDHEKGSHTSLPIGAYTEKICSNTACLQIK